MTKINLQFAARLLAVALLFATLTAQAHKPSDSYLTIANDGSRTLSVRLDIALRDLEIPLHIDTNRDGEITWGEVKQHSGAIAEYAHQHLRIRSENLECATTVPAKLLVDAHTDGNYAVLEFGADCADVPTTIDIEYRLFFDIDPSHRGLVRIDAGAVQQSAVFSPENPRQVFVLASTSRWRTVTQFLFNGVEHIWVGYDHILFLVSLLLPAVLFRSDRKWVPVAKVRTALIDVLAVVTAFTLSHSITLTLAALGLIGLSSWIVESGIALSVLLAALNNVFPVVSRRVWLLAFAFGFVHGLGFASVLADLGLPRDALALALASFNIGVEIGQLSIVMVVVPIIYWLRTRRFYVPFVLVGGSCVIAAIASAWLVSRLFDLGLG